MDCAYLAIASTEPVARPLCYGLRRLQHRGQETAGIFTFDGTGIHSRGNEGMVHEVFGPGGEVTRRRLKKLRGNWGLAATRYRTSGSDKSAPPFWTDNPCLVVGAYNGNIINCERLWGRLKRVGQHRVTDCDLEALLKTFGHELSTVMGPREPLRNQHIYSAAANLMEKVEGSYSAVFLVAKGERQRMVAVRDPSANRPMVIGKAAEGTPRQGWIIAPEDCAFDDLGYVPVAYPEGGEVNIIKWNFEREARRVA